MKEYYTENFCRILYVYLQCPQAWRNRSCQETVDFGAVSYFDREDQFRKLQRYARSGRIIATEGSIDDLGFLQRHDVYCERPGLACGEAARSINVSVIDTSNICDYTFLDFQIPDARVIWTTGIGSTGTTYYSEELSFLQPAEREEMKQLIMRLKGVWNGQEVLDEKFAHLLHMRTLSFFRKENNSPIAVPIFSRQSLDILKRYCFATLFRVKESKLIYVARHFKPCDLIANCDPDLFESLNPGLKERYGELIQYQHASMWINFVHLEGWKQAFEKRFLQPEHQKEFPQFLKELKGNYLEFKRRFGEERWARCMQSLQGSPVSPALSGESPSVDIPKSMKLCKFREKYLPWTALAGLTAAVAVGVCLKGRQRKTV